MSKISSILEIIDEGINDYYLYHGTSAIALANILTTNRLEARSPYAIDENRVLYGASLTRDLKFAENWVGTEAVIVFDSQKLRNNYKLIPRGATNFLNQPKTAKNNKAEEFLYIGDNKHASINNIRKYVIKVLVSSKSKNMNALLKGLNDLGIESELY